MCLKCASLIKAIDAYIAKVDDDFADLLDGEGYAASKKTMKAAKQIEEEVSELLEDETELFLSKINESVDLETFANDVWPSVVLDDATSVKLTEVFKEQLSEFIPPLIDDYIKRTDKSLKLSSVSKRTLDWIDRWSGQLGNIMQLNSHKQIESILKKGLENGDSIATFTRNIMDSGIRNEYYRARSVAVTEVLRAHSVSQQEAYMQSPVVEKKKWMHTGEYKNQPRENHVNMDGTIVDKDQPYELLGADGVTYYPMYPRDADLPAGEVVNCHCISIPIVNEDILGLSAEEKQELQAEALAEMDEVWENELDEMYREMQSKKE